MIPIMTVPPNIPNVPFYSQIVDIQAPEWQKKGCGIASLAMVIDFYKAEAISVDKLLGQATSSGAYDYAYGWKHKDLVLLAKKYGLDGNNYDLGASDTKTAFNKLKESLADGPIIASVHYKFDPKSTIPHLVVIDGIEGDLVYYNDPAAKSGSKTISVDTFLKAWKKKYIVVKPLPENKASVIALSTSL